MDAAEGSMHSKCTINFLNEWKNSNKQSNFEREKQSWKNQTPWLQIILQSYSNQNNMILEQKKGNNEPFDYIFPNDREKMEQYMANADNK